MAKPNQDFQQPLSFDADVGASAGASLPSVTSAPGQAGPQRVVELFAGIGGFRFGLERVNAERQAQGLELAYEVVWANQWEPGKTKQHAAQVYEARWGEAPVNADIAAVLEDASQVQALLDARPTMLVAGFPCQDYSVARPQGEGLQGKKGVLWWQIHKLLRLSQEAGQPIGTLLLENVDRLLNSPTKSRGRDFAIILASLQELGYAVAWQVVNAADYGHAQRRRRVFIVGVHRSLPSHANWKQALAKDSLQWLIESSPLARALPVAPRGPGAEFRLGCDAIEVQYHFAQRKGKTPFASSGVCIDGMVWTQATRAASIHDYSPYVGQTRLLTLGDIVAETTTVDPSYFLDEHALARWRHLKGAKCVPRVAKTGYEYAFSEGAVAFPDPLDRPSRTILTSEGGNAASRTKHVVEHADGRLRRLTPEELECLTGFPRGYTDVAGLSATHRAFLLGNALVTGVVTSIGQVLAQIDDDGPVEAPGDHLTQESDSAPDGYTEPANDEARGSRALPDVPNISRIQGQEAQQVDPYADIACESNFDIVLPAPHMYRLYEACALVPQLQELLMSGRQRLLTDQKLMLVPGFGVALPTALIQPLFRDLKAPCTVSPRALVLQLPSVYAHLLPSLAGCLPQFVNRHTLEGQNERTHIIFRCETNPASYGTLGCRELRLCVDEAHLSSLTDGFRYGSGMELYAPLVILAGNSVVCGGFLIDDSFIADLLHERCSKAYEPVFVDGSEEWTNAQRQALAHGSEPWCESAVLERDYFGRHEQAVVYLRVPVTRLWENADD